VALVVDSSVGVVVFSTSATATPSSTTYIPSLIFAPSTNTDACLHDALTKS
jgi:hypothetical protein